MRALVSLLLASELLGCGTDVAQTAMRTPATTLVCPAPETPPTLPGAAALGGGAVIAAWAPATGEYGAGQGPGVTVAARDGFRLFVNGHLLAESTASLVPAFVPLTLLPGENVIAVVVTSASGAPALLFHLDELERELVSGASFRANATPAGDWMLPGFDDSDWASVVDHGTPAENPECRPALGFPAGSPARWITAALPAETMAFRLRVRVAPVGFGAGTTGGGNAEPVLVADGTALAAALISDDPQVILVPEGVFDARRPEAEAAPVDACPTECPDAPGKLQYTLMPADVVCDVPTVPRTRNDRRLKVTPEKTLVGLGRGALMRGLWLDLADSENVILRNIALYDVNPGLIEAGDAISIASADSIWVDHVTFKWISDGFIDITQDSTNITGSFLRFDGTNPAACQGRHERASEILNSLVTFHHTSFSHLSGRAPLATHALSRIHLFDDVFADTVGYTVGAGCGAELRIESSVFESVAAPTSKRDCSDGTTGASAIDAVAGSNVYGTGVAGHDALGVASPEPHDVVFDPPYAYSLDPVTEVKFRVGERAGAGARWALPLELD